LNITILNVSVSTQQKPGGKPYQVAEVGFKNNTFQGKIEGKKITSYSKVFNQVVEAQPGTTFDVTTEKNGQFVEWVSLQPAAPGGVPAIPNTPQAGATRSSPPPAAARGNFETPEERAKRQVYIIRQSSLSTAAAVLAISPAKSGPSAKAVIEMAKEFEAYVFGVPGLTGFEDVPNLDPSFNTEPQID
jgi:hypothetical protein